jgi:hypothetical protein
MNMYLLRRLWFLFALLCVTAVASHPGAALSKTATPKATAPAAAATTDAASTATTSDQSATAAPPAADTDDFNDEPESVDRHGRLDWRNRIETRHRHRHDTDNDIVSIGHSSHLQSGEKADAVVSVFGSSTSEGEAGDVVSVMGNTRVTGPVHDSAVAVLGNVYIDSKVDGDVVAVLGNVTLGPNAEIGGDVVAVLGTMQRDPAAITHGSVQRVLNFDAGVGGFDWLNTWITHCLLYARPLAFVHGLGWAWTLALGLLAFYACLALLFRSGVDQCVHTLETEPGHTALAALIGILLTPVLLVLLCVTVIGIAAVPFVVGALFCMSLFGKAVMLAWLGGRVTGRRPGPAGHPAVAILIGGALVLLLYVVPVVGFLVYKLLGFFGFGAVVYTLVLRARARRAFNGASPPSAGARVSDLHDAATTASATMAGAGWTASAAPAAAGAAAAASCRSGIECRRRRPGAARLDAATVRTACPGAPAHHGGDAARRFLDTHGGLAAGCLIGRIRHEPAAPIRQLPYSDSCHLRCSHVETAGHDGRRHRVRFARGSIGRAAGRLGNGDRACPRLLSVVIRSVPGLYLDCLRRQRSGLARQNRRDRGGAGQAGRTVALGAAQSQLGFTTARGSRPAAMPCICGSRGGAPRCAGSVHSRRGTWAAALQ